MILLAIQIWLTVRAFRNGWRKRVITPWLISLGISGLIGFSHGINGTPIEQSLPLVTLLDFGLAAALGLMAAMPPEDHPVGLGTEINTGGRSAA